MGSPPSGSGGWSSPARESPRVKGRVVEALVAGFTRVTSRVRLVVVVVVVVGMEAFRSTASPIHRGRDPYRVGWRVEARPQKSTDWVLKQVRVRPG